MSPMDPHMDVTESCTSNIDISALTTFPLNMNINMNMNININHILNYNICIYIVETLSTQYFKLNEDRQKYPDRYTLQGFTCAEFIPFFSLCD